MNQALDELKRVKERIRKGWCQSAYAETRDGDATHPFSCDAEKFCVLGACRVERAYAARNTIENYIYNNTNFKGVTSFNDDPSTTKKSVLLLLNKVIKSVEEGAAHD